MESNKPQRKDVSRLDSLQDKAMERLKEAEKFITTATHAVVKPVDLKAQNGNA